MITEILQTFNDRYQVLQGNATKYHENTRNFEKLFAEDREKLCAAFEKFCNPFEECGEELINIFTRQVFLDESVKHAEKIGREKRQLFIKERLTDHNTSLYNTIHRNNLPLFRARKQKAQSKAKIKVHTQEKMKVVRSSLCGMCIMSY